MGYSLPRPSCLIAKQPSLFWLDIERFPQQQCIPVTSSSDDQLPTLSGAHIAMRASSSRRQPISCERLVQLGTAAVLPGAARPKIRVRMRHLSAITVHLLHNERRLSPFFGEDTTTRSTKRAYFHLGDFDILYSFRLLSDIFLASRLRKLWEKSRTVMLTERCRKIPILENIFNGGGRKIWKRFPQLAQRFS